MVQEMKSQKLNCKILSDKSGIGLRQIYNIRSNNTKPTLEQVIKLINAMGLKLVVTRPKTFVPYCDQENA